MPPDSQTDIEAVAEQVFAALADPSRRARRLVIQRRRIGTGYNSKPLTSKDTGKCLPVLKGDESTSIPLDYPNLNHRLTNRYPFGHTSHRLDGKPFLPTEQRLSDHLE